MSRARRWWLGWAALALVLGCGRSDPTPAENWKGKPKAGEAPRPIRPGKADLEPVPNPGAQNPLPKK